MGEWQDIFGYFFLVRSMWESHVFCNYFLAYKIADFIQVTAIFLAQ